MESASFAGSQPRLLDAVAAHSGLPTTAVNRSPGERHPGQARDRLTVAHQAEQDRRHRRARRVVERAVDRVEHPHQR